ncbi:MAG: recombinase family protein, partial [Parasporobacterium sp.]|nr:recombinase family protein [Parasporobacterium sp.]
MKGGLEVKSVEIKEQTGENRGGSVRVAAYCKASPDLERQQASREVLAELYSEKIIGTPNWTLAGIYVECPNPNRKSKRPQFLKLMKDCDDGKIDCILCKTISIFLQAKREEVRMLRRVLD